MNKCCLWRTTFNCSKNDHMIAAKEIVGAQPMNLKLLLNPTRSMRHVQSDKNGPVRIAVCKITVTLTKSVPLLLCRLLPHMPWWELQSSQSAFLKTENQTPQKKELLGGLHTLKIETPPIFRYFQSNVTGRNVYFGIYNWLPHAYHQPTTVWRTIFSNDSIVGYGNLILITKYEFPECIWHPVGYLVLICTFQLRQLLENLSRISLHDYQSHYVKNNLSCSVSNARPICISSPKWFVESRQQKKPENKLRY